MTPEHHPGRPSDGQQPVGGGMNAPRPAEPQATHGPPEEHAAPEEIKPAETSNLLRPEAAGPPGGVVPCAGWEDTPEGDLLGYAGVVDEHGRFVGREWIEFRGNDLITRTGRTPGVAERQPRPRWPTLHLTAEDARLLHTLHEWFATRGKEGAELFTPEEEARLDHIFRERDRVSMNERRVIRRRLKSVLGKQEFVRRRRRGQFDDLYRR